MRVRQNLRGNAQIHIKLIDVLDDSEQLKKFPPIVQRSSRLVKQYFD